MTTAQPSAELLPFHDKVRKLACEFLTLESNMKASVKRIKKMESRAEKLDSAWSACSKPQKESSLRMECLQRLRKMVALRIDVLARMEALKAASVEQSAENDESTSDICTATIFGVDYICDAFCLLVSDVSRLCEMAVSLQQSACGTVHSDAVDIDAVIGEAKVKSKELQRELRTDVFAQVLIRTLFNVSGNRVTVETTQWTRCLRAFIGCFPYQTADICALVHSTIVSPHIIQPLFDATDCRITDMTVEKEMSSGISELSFVFESDTDFDSDDFSGDLNSDAKTQVRSELQRKAHVLAKVNAWIRDHVFASLQPLFADWLSTSSLSSEVILHWLQSALPLATPFVDTGFADFVSAQMEAKSYLQRIDECRVDLRKATEVLQSERDLFAAADLSECTNLCDDTVFDTFHKNRVRRLLFAAIRTEITVHDFDDFNPATDWRTLGCEVKGKSDGDSLRLEAAALMKQILQKFLRTNSCRVSLTCVRSIVVRILRLLFLAQTFEADFGTFLTEECCVGLVQLFPRLCGTVHRGHFEAVPCLALQFASECALVAFVISQLSLRFAHCVPISLLQATRSLSQAGDRFVVGHLHSRRLLVLNALNAANAWRGLESKTRFEQMKQRLNECVLCIAQFLGGCNSAIADSLLFEMAGSWLRLLCSGFVEQTMARVKSPIGGDIGAIEAAHISQLVEAVAGSSLLADSIEYISRFAAGDWQRFLAIGKAMHGDASLKTLTELLYEGDFDCFEAADLKTIVSALFMKSPKRVAFFDIVDFHFDALLGSTELSVQ